MGMSVPEAVTTRVTAGRPVLRPLIPNLVWDAVLAVALIVVAGVVTANTTLFDRSLPWGQFATVGIAATGLALSLRTRTPNLAVSALAGFAGYMFADHVTSGTSVVGAMLIAVASCLVIGVVIGVLVGVTDLPAWAVTLGVATLLQAIYLGRYGAGRSILVNTPDSRLTNSDLRTWTLAFAVLSVGGAVVLAIPAVRRALGMTEVTGDPPRFNAYRLVGAVVGLGGSSTLAGLAGVLLVRWTAVADAGSAGNLLLPTLGAVLLGGVSVFGRRGGLVGVVLAVGLVVVLNSWMPFGDGTSYAAHLGLYGAVIIVGLLVGWTIALIARALEAPVKAPPELPPSAVPSPAGAPPASTPPEGADEPAPPPETSGPA
jgi:ribose/xylose/arabinose/galactoside ABC-type transport system permease subunit